MLRCMRLNGQEFTCQEPEHSPQCQHVANQMIEELLAQRVPLETLEPRKYSFDGNSGTQHALANHGKGGFWAA